MVAFSKYVADTKPRKARLADVGRFVDCSGSTSGGVFARQLAFVGPGDDMCTWGTQLHMGRAYRGGGTDPSVIFTTPNPYLDRPIPCIMTDGMVGDVARVTRVAGALRDKAHVICVITGNYHSTSVFAAVTAHATSYSLLVEKCDAYEDTMTKKTYKTLEEVLADVASVALVKFVNRISV